ncbi:MAG: hypothetical protein ACRDK7_13235 [Solirubrobacteraceae bacterium]
MAGPRRGRAPFGPGCPAIYALGQSVQTSFSCAEGPGGPGLSSCDDSTGTATVSGGSGHLDTSTAGTRTYTVTATSKDGATGRESIIYNVAAPPPAVTIRTARAVVTGGGTKVKLACGGGLADSICRGKLSLAVKVKRSHGHGKHRVTRTKTLLIAHADYTIPAGKDTAVALAGRQTTVVLRLTTQGLRLLRAAHRHRLRVRATATVSGGHTAHRVILLRHE